ncbi:hypothetical protein KR009_002586, partial [Drosophila setifemur]
KMNIINSCILVVTLTILHCPDSYLATENLFPGGMINCHGYCFGVLKPVLEYFVVNTKVDNSEKLRTKIDTLASTNSQLMHQLATAEAQIRHHVQDNSEQVKSKDDQIKDKNDLIKSKDEQIDDLRNQINLISTKLGEKSMELLTCQAAKDALPDSCPSGSPNGIYELKLPDTEPFEVPCKSSTFGWTVIQRRQDGSVNFSRSWKEYKEGFGDVRGEFFIGLEKLHLMTTARPHEIFITLKQIDGNTRYVGFSNFSIDNENEYYKIINLGSYSGTAGDSLWSGKVFSTFDNDSKNENLPTIFGGGWWFTGCMLNGRYYKPGDTIEYPYIFWGPWTARDSKVPLAATEMMIRPVF